MLTSSIIQIIGQNFNFPLKKLLVFGATYIEKNNDKRKYVYSVYGRTFDGKSEWNFGNESVRNV